MRSHLLAVVSVLAFAALPALGEAGDAAAVMQYCGTPTSEHQGISQVTNRMERDLTYGGVILHFQPSENGWTFLSGWDDHLPMTEKMVEARMPCFRQAMAAAAAQQPHGAAANEDPTIRDQTAAPAADTSTFGIPHLWLILVLAAVVLVLFLLPRGGRPRQTRAMDVEKMRYRRKPRILGRTFRRGDGSRLDV